MSIHLCICQSLTEPFRTQAYQAHVSKHFPASEIAFWFGDCIWEGSPGGAVSGWPFPQSLLHTLSLYFLLWVFFPLLRTEASKLWSSFFLSFIWSVSCIMGIPTFFLISTYKWVHTMCVLLWLGYLTQNSIFYFHPFACEFHEVTVFNSCVVLHCVNVSHFLHPLLCWGTSGLFLASGYCK